VAQREVEPVALEVLHLGVRVMRTSTPGVSRVKAGEARDQP
jgi:hypothetical protein